jgi:hypothetical protein
MTEVEHYALSLIFCALVGIQVGVGAQSIDDQKEGKRKRFDFVWLLASIIAIIYGFLAIKFVDGPHLIWGIGLIFWFGGRHFGKSIAAVRDEKSIAVIILAILASIPILYHNVLS